MSREKIKEMTEILKDYTKKQNIMASVVILEDYAEELYKQGYRKQSEGEWVTKDYTAYCSVCKIGRDIESQFGWKYCPNCGAKMKG